MKETAIRNLKRNIIGLLILSIILIGAAVWSVFRIMSTEEGAARSAAGFIYGLLLLYYILPGSVIAAVFAIVCTRKMAKSDLADKGLYVVLGNIAGIICLLPLITLLVWAFYSSAVAA